MPLHGAVPKEGIKHYLYRRGRNDGYIFYRPANQEGPAITEQITCPIGNLNDTAVGVGKNQKLAIQFGMAVSPNAAREQ